MIVPFIFVITTNSFLEEKKVVVVTQQNKLCKVPFWSIIIPER